MAWEVKQEKTQDKIVFTKFNEGNTKIRILSDENPYSRWNHWIQTAGFSTTCNGAKNDCPICKIIQEQKAKGITPSYGSANKFAFYAYNYNTKQIEIVEQGVTFINGIMDLIEDRKEEGLSTDLTTFDITIKRKGTGQQDTRYTFKASDDGELSDEFKQMLIDAGDIKDRFITLTNEQIQSVLDGKSLKEVTQNNSN